MNSDLQNSKIYINPLITMDDISIEDSLTGSTNVSKSNLNISFLLYNKDLNENNLRYINLSFDKNIDFMLNKNNIHFKLTSVYSNNTLTPRYYDQNGYKVYVYYTDIGDNKQEHKLYDDIYIRSTRSNINLYVAFNPIYKINYTPGTLNSTSILFNNKIMI